MGEGQTAAVRGQMEVFGHHTLAGAALSRDKYGGVAVAYLLHSGTDLHYGGAFPNQRGRLDSVGTPQLSHPLADPSDLLHLFHQIGRIKGLGDIVVSLHLHGGHRPVDGAVGSHHNDNHGQALLTDGPKHLQAITDRHADIQHGSIIPYILQ